MEAAITVPGTPRVTMMMSGRATTAPMAAAPVAGVVDGDGAGDGVGCTAAVAAAAAGTDGPHVGPPPAEEVLAAAGSAATNPAAATGS